MMNLNLSESGHTSNVHLKLFLVSQMEIVICKKCSFALRLAALVFHFASAGFNFLCKTATPDFVTYLAGIVLCINLRAMRGWFHPSPTFFCITHLFHMKLNLDILGNCCWFI